jgi:hypothetical protein
MIVPFNRCAPAGEQLKICSPSNSSSEFTGGAVRTGAAGGAGAGGG